MTVQQFQKLRDRFKPVARFLDIEVRDGPVAFMNISHEGRQGSMIGADAKCAEAVFTLLYAVKCAQKKAEASVSTGAKEYEIVANVCRNVMHQTWNKLSAFRVLVGAVAVAEVLADVTLSKESK